MPTAKGGSPGCILEPLDVELLRSSLICRLVLLHCATHRTVPIVCNSFTEKDISYFGKKATFQIAIFLSIPKYLTYYLGGATSHVQKILLRYAVLAPGFLKETGGVVGPALIKSLADTELWQLAKMDEVVSYLAGSKYLCLPDSYNEAFTD